MPSVVEDNDRCSAGLLGSVGSILTALRTGLVMSFCSGKGGGEDVLEEVGAAVGIGIGTRLVAIVLVRDGAAACSEEGTDLVACLTILGSALDSRDGASTGGCDTVEVKDGEEGAVDELPIDDVIQLLLLEIGVLLLPVAGGILFCWIAVSVARREAGATGVDASRA